MFCILNVNSDAKWSSILLYMPFRCSPKQNTPSTGGNGTAQPSHPSRIVKYLQTSISIICVFLCCLYTIFILMMLLACAGGSPITYSVYFIFTLRPRIRTEHILNNVWGRHSNAHKILFGRALLPMELWCLLRILCLRLFAVCRNSRTKYTRAF